MSQSCLVLTYVYPVSDVGTRHTIYKNTGGYSYHPDHDHERRVHFST